MMKIAGEANSQAKLEERHVRAIRQLYTCREWMSLAK